jgi:hypothetical protein
VTGRSDARRLVPRLAVLVTTLLVAGCVTVYEGKLNPALFSRSEPSPDGRATAKVAVVADAASAQFKYERTRPAPRLVIPVGQIVAAASVAAMSDEFGQSVVSYPSVGIAAEATAAVGSLTLVTPGAANFELHEEYFVIPFFAPIVLTTRQDVRLIVDWQVQDAAGRLLWNKRYDSGDVKLPPRTTADHGLPDGDLWLRLAHQVAYTLMRQAAADVCNWLEAERLRERVL